MGARPGAGDPIPALRQRLARGGVSSSPWMPGRWRERGGVVLQGWHLLRAYCAPGVTGSSEVGFFFCPHCTDEKAEAGREQIAASGSPASQYLTPRLLDAKAGALPTRARTPTETV